MTEQRKRQEGTPRGPLLVLTILLSTLITGCVRTTCSGTSAFGNLGTEINSPWDDYAPVLPDTTTLIYASNRLGPDRGGLRELTLDYHPAYLYRTLRLTEEWDAPTRWEILRANDDEIETGPTALPPTNNPHGVFAYTTSCNLPENDLWSGGCDVVMVRGVPGDRRISPVPGLNSPLWEGQPFVTADGTRLYFASDRDGGQGGSDIWYIELGTDGSWGPTKNAGTPINTPADEGSPFVDPETGRLYFAGMTPDGSWDIFMVERNRNERVRLPAPINTVSAEITPWLIDGHLYVASDRPGGCGGFDLYRFAR